MVADLKMLTPLQRTMEQKGRTQFDQQMEVKCENGVTPAGNLFSIALSSRPHIFLLACEENVNDKTEIK